MTEIELHCVVRKAWAKETGAEIVVDDRTFNEEWHTYTDPTAPVAAEEPKAE